MQQPGWSRREVLGAMVVGAAYVAVPPVVGAQPASQTSGLLFRDTLLVDGTGAPGRAADVLIRGDRIEHIGTLSARELRGVRVIEAGGRVLAPGFIDLHTHGDPLEEAYTPYLAMGVTTVVLGQDGGSPSLPDKGTNADSLSSWMDAVGRATPDINIATLSA